MTEPQGDQRLRELLHAGIALNSELSLDALLQKVVKTAASLTGARYAALGVIDESGDALERFVTTGIDPELQASIGALPRGRGILGVVINDATALRLTKLSDDPRSVGFPPNHPSMDAFLGVPVIMRGVAYGNLYLTEKEGGDPSPPRTRRPSHVGRAGCGRNRERIAVRLSRRARTRTGGWTDGVRRRCRPSPGRTARTHR